MKLGLQLEFEWWKQFLPLIFLFLLLTPLIFGFAPFFGFTLLLFIIVLSQFREEQRAGQLMFELSLPIEREERLAARFIMYGLVILLIVITFFLLSTTFLTFLSTRFDAITVAFTGPLAAAFVIWASVLFVMIGTLLFLYTRFTFKWASWLFFFLFIALNLVLVFGLFATSTDTPIATSTVEVTKDTMITEIDVLQTLQTIAFFSFPLSLLYYYLCFVVTRRAFLKKTLPM